MSEEDTRRCGCELLHLMQLRISFLPISHIMSSRLDSDDSHPHPVELRIGDHSLPRRQPFDGDRSQLIAARVRVIETAAFRLEFDTTSQSVACGRDRHLWHDPLMRNLVRRTAIVILAVTGAALFGVGIGSAEPLNCVNGQFWDPITNTCQTPRPAEDCGPGQYWNALSNVCRPLGEL